MKRHFSKFIAIVVLAIMVYSCKKETNSPTLTNYSNIGLINHTVYAIAIDAHGNKWVGTQQGIAKFDGVSWTNYVTYDKYNISGDMFVYTVVVDKQGNIWFGTDHGVYELTEN